MCPLPFLYAVLWFCIFGVAGISMNRRAIWLENIGTTGFDNANCVCMCVCVYIYTYACGCVPLHVYVLVHMHV